VISLWGLDSHFFKFRSTFSKISGWLKPRGCILFEYQDYGHWIRLIFPKIKQGPNVYYNFTRHSFARFVRQLGLQIVMQRTGVQVTQVRRVISELKFGTISGAIGDLKILIPTPSYMVAVLRKEPP
jgi:hypothetical protein